MASLLNISLLTLLALSFFLLSSKTFPHTENSLSTLIVLAGGVWNFLAVDDSALSIAQFDLLICLQRDTPQLSEQPAL